ncbi:MAG: nuclear transport factor 2 family protein [Chloroflexota bacterium]
MTVSATSTTEQTLAAIERFNTAFNSHDVDAIMACMTDDCVFEDTSPPDGGRRVGQAAVREAWEGLFKGSPSAYFVAEETVAVDDRCVVCWRYEWKNADGTTGHIRGIDLFRVRDGKVAEKLAYVKG